MGKHLNPPCPGCSILGPLTTSALCAHPLVCDERVESPAREQLVGPEKGMRARNVDQWRMPNLHGNAHY